MLILCFEVILYEFSPNIFLSKIDKSLYLYELTLVDKARSISMYTIPIGIAGMNDE